MTLGPVPFPFTWHLIELVETLAQEVAVSKASNRNKQVITDLEIFRNHFRMPKTSSQSDFTELLRAVNGGRPRAPTASALGRPLDPSNQGPASWHPTRMP